MYTDTVIKPVVEVCNIDPMFSQYKKVIKEFRKTMASITPQYFV